MSNNTITPPLTIPASTRLAFRRPRSSAILLLLCLLSLSAAARADNAWPPFHHPWEAPKDAVADAGFLLDAPAGKHGRVVVRDGHLAFEEAGRVRFWATNLSGEGGCPPKEVTPRLADRLAKFGFNLARFHGLDSTWGNALFPRKAATTQEFDPAQLDRLDFIVAELVKRGIYVNLNLHVARRFTPGDGLPETEFLGYAKYCVLFNPRMIELQKDFARTLLTHRNPYTGKTYAEDPAVIIVELTNENSLFGGWTGGFLKGKQSKKNPGTWSDIPPYYGRQLTELYNRWLAKRYPTRQALEAAWKGAARPPGPQMLTNGDFSAGKDKWDLSQGKTTQAELAITKDAPGGKPAAKVTVGKVDGTSWHVILTQRPLTLKKGKDYRVAFRARASAERDIAAEVCHSSPYRGYGHRRLELGTDWQECYFAFTAPEDDSDVRLSFQFGQATGTVWIRDVILHEAPLYGMREDEDPARGTVARLAPEDFASHTVARFRDEGRFYYDIESRYNLDMARFLRDQLKVRALIQGTNHNYGLPSLRAQALLDHMDCHAYWQHPHFPRQPWSRTDWFIKNTPMLDAPRANCISQLVRSSVTGKPFTVSEYNHPFPNEYGCEMPLTLAAYACLQDWDAVYGYTFNHRYDEALLGGDKVTGYFDLANEATKMAQMPTASLIFQRGLVAPARKLVTVNYDEDRTYDSLKERRWDRTGYHIAGELSPLLPLVHRFRVGRFDADSTTRADEIAFVEPADRIASDTGELLWQAGKERQGRLTIDTPRAQAAVGWIGGQTVATADAEFRLDTPFCAVSLVALDELPLGRSKKILLVAAARCANTDMQWNADRTSTTDQWGQPPLRIEPVTGTLTLRRQGTGRLTLTPLDGAGRAKSGAAASAAVRDGRARLELKADSATLWYLLAE